MVRPWNRLPRESVTTLYLGIFKTKFNRAWSSHGVPPHGRVC